MVPLLYCSTSHVYLLLALGSNNLQPGARYFCHAHFIPCLIDSGCQCSCSMDKWYPRQCSFDKEPVLTEISPAIEGNRDIGLMCFNIDKTTLLEAVNILFRCEPLSSHGLGFARHVNFWIVLS